MTARAISGDAESAASVDAIGAQSSSAIQHIRPRSFAIACPPDNRRQVCRKSPDRHMPRPLAGDNPVN
jgi:hypothetical protein